MDDGRGDFLPHARTLVRGKFPEIRNHMLYINSQSVGEDLHVGLDCLDRTFTDCGNVVGEEVEKDGDQLVEGPVEGIGVELIRRVLGYF
jgi:hypothetical protein